MMKSIRQSGLGVVWVAAFAIWLLPAARSSAATSIKTIEPGTLQVCLYPGFKPFAWEEGGVWKGWDVDYLEGFAKEHGLKFGGVEVRQFNGIWREPGAGKCDIAATGISDTQDRRDDSPGGYWSRTYYTVVRAYLIRSKDKLNDVQGLRGKTVIVTNGSTADTDLQNRSLQARIKDVTIHYTDDEAAAADKVLKGDAFAYGGGYGSVKALAPEGSGLKVVWPHCNMVVVGNAFKEYAEPFSFVVSKADAGLPAALDAYIDHHKYEGTGNPPSVKCKARPKSSK